MKVTSKIPCGNGRIVKATPELIEVELIAYSKGSRYTFFQISDVQEMRRQEILLRPDQLFRIPTFPYKRFSEVWVRYGEGGEWKAATEIEKMPEGVRLWVDLYPGQSCFVSTEPPREYTKTTKELCALSHALPSITSLHCLGHSIEGRPIFLLRVTEPENFCTPGEEQLPVIHIACGEHATEFSGEEMGRGMLALVTSSEGASLRRRYIFDFVLTMNPDGNFHGWHQYNAQDWLFHNYSDTDDRSWHHEFVPYITGEPGPFSPETVASMDWLRLTRPAFYISLHSWEGHSGNPGSFYTASETLTPQLAVAMDTINEIASVTAQERGYAFDACPTTNLGPAKHLGHLLMDRDVCIAYLPEGNYAIGRPALQDLGATLLQRCLEDARLPLKAYGKERWDCLSGAATFEGSAVQAESPLALA